MSETFHSPEQVKVFILYLLEKVGYPLEYNDLATIVIRDGFVDYFDFVTCFHELIDAGHIVKTESDGEMPPQIPDWRGVSPSTEPEPDEGYDGHIPEDEDEPEDAGEPDEKENTSDRSDEDGGEPEEAGGQPAAPAEDAPAEETKKPAPKKPVSRKECYVVSDTGRMIARGLSDDLLLSAVREKSYISAMRHLSLEKRGAVCDHSIEREGDGYVFHCSIKDRDGMAFRLDLRADSYMQVQRMRMNFEDKPDVVYRGIVALVTGNVNYLFEK